VKTFANLPKIRAQKESFNWLTGEVGLVIGETIEKESTICMVHEEKQKSFPLKSMVNFSVDEFSELTWSFFLFAEELVKSINAYGIDQGFIPKAEPARERSVTSVTINF
jgi:hypothetical protein